MCQNYGNHVNCENSIVQLSLVQCTAQSGENLVRTLQLNKDLK